MCKDHVNVKFRAMINKLSHIFISSLIPVVSGLLLGGCLWVCRVPFPVTENFSDEGECTNRVWRSVITDVRIKGCKTQSTNFCFRCYYPTIVMRYKAWEGLYGSPLDPSLKGEELYRARWQKRLGWIPLTLVWLGAPLDAAVDTLMLPYDYHMLNKGDNQ